MGIYDTLVYKPLFHSMPKPSPRPTRERDPDARKERILAAAGRVFADLGFPRGSMREISLKASVNLASINYYFGSKEGLYREVLLAAHRQLLEQEPPPEPAADPRQALREWIGYCLHFVLRKRSAHPVLGRLMAHELREPTPALGELVERVVQPIFANLTRIVDALAGDSLDQAQREMAAHQIVAMCVHFDHCREATRLLGFAVPETEAGIAGLALHGLTRPADGKPRSRKQPSK